MSRQRACAASSAKINFLRAYRWGIAATALTIVFTTALVTVAAQAMKRPVAKGAIAAPRIDFVAEATIVPSKPIAKAKDEPASPPTPVLAGPVRQADTPAQTAEPQSAADIATPNPTPVLPIPVVAKLPEPDAEQVVPKPPGLMAARLEERFTRKTDAGTQAVVVKKKAAQADLPQAGGDCGTAVRFAGTPFMAAMDAKKQDKLIFLLHVSGNFEDPRFT